MLKRAIGILAICVLTPTVAFAQYGGGGGGAGAGGGHGHGGRRGGDSSDSSAPLAKPSATPTQPQTPVNQVQIVGVVTAVDTASQRITIHYEATDALNLPEGTVPFEVSQTNLLNGVSVGEKVRFRLESHQIAEIKPFVAASPTASVAGPIYLPPVRP